MQRNRTEITREETTDGVIKAAFHLHSRRVNGGHRIEQEARENLITLIEQNPREAARSVFDSALRLVKALDNFHVMLSKPDTSLTDRELHARERSKYQETVDHGSKLVGSIRTFVHERGTAALLYLENAADLSGNTDSQEAVYQQYVEPARDIVIDIAEKKFDEMIELGLLATDDTLDSLVE